MAFKKRGWNGGGKQAYWEAPVVNNRDGRSPRLHSAQKPLGLMESLVRDFTDPGDLVCDPFAGSGTTGVACIKNGRRFIGWEKDAAHAAAAADRLSRAREQYTLFDQPAQDAAYSG